MQQLSLLVSPKACSLHMACFYGGCAIGVAIFAILIYSLLKYRHAKGSQVTHFHPSVGLEIFWTVVPFLILAVLVMPTITVLNHTCG